MGGPVKIHAPYDVRRILDTTKDRHHASLVDCISELLPISVAAAFLVGCPATTAKHFAECRTVKQQPALDVGIGNREDQWNRDIRFADARNPGVDPWQFASVATTIKSGHGAPCRLMSRR